MLLPTKIYQSEITPSPPRAFAANLDPQVVQWLENNFELLMALSEFLIIGNGVPTGQIKANNGAIFIQVDGPTLWVKQSGVSGDTAGWVSK